MGLDDAIRTARQQADYHEEQVRAEKESVAQQLQKQKELCAEAIGRLKPYGREAFYHIRWSSRGKHRLGDRRYDALAAKRCWMLQGGRSAAHPKLGGWYECPLLLLDDGTVGIAWLDVKSKTTGQYMTSLDLTPLDQDRFPLLGSDTGDGLLGRLERDLAEAIVRYERAG
ncbi:hypothetical protein ACWEQ8_41735 [Streptomyces noursei]